MKNHIKAIIYVIHINLISINMAFANFTISPMNQELSIKKSSANYVLHNYSQQKTAYKISAFQRKLSINGEEIREETKDIRVFPSKVILKPNQRKRIKVLYTGTKKLKEEKSYRVIFNQEKVNIDHTSIPMRANYEFVTSLYVTPKNASPKLSTVISNESNKHLTITVSNNGNKHKILQNWSVYILDSNNNKFIYKDVLQPLNLLANSKTEIVLDKNKIETKNIKDISLHFNKD